MDKILVPLVCLFAAKVVILGVHYPEALALLIFAAFVLVKQHYDTHKSVNEYKKALEETKTSNLKEVEDLKKDIDMIKTSIASVKLANGMRGINGKP